uniref:Uncharacterized protein n=1 Tax=Geobacter sp. (strain M21) TaxID=443144 RepID=C6E0L0_GEOSM
MFNIDEVIIAEYLLWLAVLVAGGVLLVGKTENWGLLDPLNVIILSLAFNVTNVVITRPATEVTAYLLSGLTVFYLSIKFGHKLSTKYGISSMISKFTFLTYVPSRPMSVSLFWLSIFFQVIYFSILFDSVGFGLLTGSASPDIKTMLTLEGRGIYKYIFWAGTFLFFPAIANIWIRWKSRFYLLVALIFYLVTSIVFGTSKSGTIMNLFSIWILHVYYLRTTGKTLVTNKLLFFIGGFGLLGSIITLGYYSKSHDTSIIKFLLTRLIDTGGGSFGYFALGAHQAFDSFGILDRWTYYFDTFLSVSRVKPWADPNIMATVTQYLSGAYQLGYGQNPFLFLSGHFLFGYIGGICYIAFVGTLYGFVRNCWYLNVLWFYFLIKCIGSLIADPDISQALTVSCTFILIAIIILYPIFLSLGIKPFHRRTEEVTAGSTSFVNTTIKGAS